MGRDIAVGDIHGSFSVLQDGLEQIGFDPTVDRLFSIGDLVDRGPESAQVLEWLDKPWFHAIMGNHELLTWRAVLGERLSRMKPEDYGGEWLQDLPVGEQRRIGERLRALPYVMEIETAAGPVGLIHADCPFDDWEQVRQTDWDALHELDDLLKISLWSRDRYAYAYGKPIANIRAVVHGHNTVPDVTVLGNVHYIDTGGGRSTGRFAFLDLDSLQPTYGAGERFYRPSRRYM
ncbi:MAG: metallophosphoesterase [Sphingomonadaceae bacterium]